MKITEVFKKKKKTKLKLKPVVLKLGGRLPLVRHRAAAVGVRGGKYGVK